MDEIQVKASVNFLEVAAALAHLNNVEQASFFNVFAREMARTCETHYKLEMQCLSIRDTLTAKAKEVIETLAYESKPEDTAP